MLKKGDKVVIRDSSYSMVVTSRGLESGYSRDTGDGIRDKQGIIVELNCKFPSQHEYQARRGNFNDTVVVLDSGETVFIEKCFLTLVLPKHTVMVDIDYSFNIVTGETVEISDRLYKEIKSEQK